jgi:predicted transcriptional regulator
MAQLGAAPSGSEHEAFANLPATIQQLYPREREIATLVYVRGKATAKEVEASLSANLTNGSVRSMLKRLVRKGILSRRRSGRHKEFVYVASITNAKVVENAARQFADDFFGGSLHRSAMAMVDLLRKEREQAAKREGPGSPARPKDRGSQKRLAA